MSDYDERLQRLNQLLMHLRDDDASEHDIRELEQIVLSHSRFADHYIELANIQAALMWRGGSENSQLISIEKARGDSLKDRLKNKSNVTARDFWSIIRWVAAAAIFLIGSGVVYELLSPNTIELNGITASIAKVTWTKPSEVLLTRKDGTPRPIQTGKDLNVDDFVDLKKGTIEVQLSSGVKVIANAPCQFEIQNSQRIHCILGKVFVRVLLPESNFQVEAVDHLITDIGTQFGVEVSRDKSFSVSVFEGMVDVDSLSNTDSADKSKFLSKPRSPIGDFQPVRVVAGMEVSVKRKEQVRSQLIHAIADLHRFPRSLQSATAIPVDSKLLTYEGRIDATDPVNLSLANPILDWPSSKIRCRFEGTSIAARFSAVASRDARFQVIIDGKRTGEFILNDGDSRIEKMIALGLNEGIHELELWKSTDLGTTVTLHEWILDEGKSMLPAPSPRKRRMEIYGDAVAVGRAIEPIKSSPDINVDSDFRDNSYLAFTGQVARQLDADTRVIAKAGLGLTRGLIQDKSGNLDSITLQKVWNATRFDTDTGEILGGLYPIDSWMADVVVVAIGHNDWAQGVEFPVFQNELKRFLKEDIRSSYPEATIFVMVTSMTDSPQWNIGISTAVAHLNDPNLYYLDFAPISYEGHPRQESHDLMARDLMTLICAKMGWEKVSK